MARRVRFLLDVTMDADTKTADGRVTVELDGAVRYDVRLIEANADELKATIEELETALDREELAAIVDALDSDDEDD